MRRAGPGSRLTLPPRALQRSLFSRESDEWQTPPEVFDPLRKEFDLQVDVCATKENAKLPEYFSREADGLTQRWAPRRCWMNAPYSRVAAWICKAEMEAWRGALVVALLPARTDTAWFHNTILANGYEVRFLKGRVTFVGARGNAPFPSMVVIFRSAF